MFSRLFRNKQNLRTVTSTLVYIAFPTSVLVSLVTTPNSYNDSIKGRFDKRATLASDNEYDEIQYNTKDDELYLCTCESCHCFRSSPCKVPFIKFKKCVDVAKHNYRDIPQVCKEYTKALFDCMENQNISPLTFTYYDDMDDFYDDLEELEVEEDQTELSDNSESLIEIKSLDKKENNSSTVVPVPAAPNDNNIHSNNRED